MNHRQRILSTIKGQKTDILPYVPRLDLWYKSNKYKNTLPKKYSSATLMEITENLDIGYHAVIPDFRDYENEIDNIGFSLGLVNLKNNAYRVDFRNIEHKVKEDGGLTEVIFKTPYGNISTKYLYNENMKRSGATIGHTTEHAIKSKDDYKAIGYIYENLEIIPTYDNHIRFQEHIGDRGVAVAFNLLSASPVHLIMKELMKFELFIYELNDRPRGIEVLGEKIKVFFDKLFDTVLDSPAEIILSGANYDSFLTWPAFFAKYITPYLKEQADKTHSKNKYLLTHTDGENKGLIKEYNASSIDIADSICPAPMTSLTFKEIRKTLRDDITIWGGLPSICVLKDSMSDYEFEKYIDSILEDIGDGSHIVLSFADTTPPDADFKRIVKVAELARNFG